ncbi:hypothetical protein E2C01_051542 [Portunus trituberculatus]|uniref:Uncharacterized protein n=1 Tax=Portunus trituberculatus TaxID=210409 RepID=A0A5B7GJ66_PORTR|nr:hypothetical protein [Portunus trituberculatus]
MARLATSPAGSSEESEPSRVLPTPAAHLARRRPSELRKEDHDG